ncbi:unnamed protein product [Nippostrongylus brasiliensis]|uniref:Innexin n=1 Tax=Nippostrongylus brasiliensis TaxID=27835 RepID=A0A0N4YGT7_NIPBR|nr:unnamed protein product [Nippostrongylus brasiliensis]
MEQELPYTVPVIKALKRFATEQLPIHYSVVGLLFISSNFDSVGFRTVTKFNKSPYESHGCTDEDLPPENGRLNSRNYRVIRLHPLPVISADSDGSFRRRRSQSAEVIYTDTSSACGWLFLAQDSLLTVDNHPAEDFIDRLNFGATVYLLAFFVLITGSKQHFGNPIQCMAPPESPGSKDFLLMCSVTYIHLSLADSWVHYYHDYCYIQDKLRIMDMSVRKSVEYEARQKAVAGADGTPIGRFLKDDSNIQWSPRVMYYQWVPYVLFLQALFYLIPKLFWKLVGSHWCHGVDLETAIIEAEKLRTLVGDDRTSALNSLANFIRDVLESKRRRSYFGSSLASICYVITKWLEVLNGVGQLYLLAAFVGEGDFFWGFRLLMSVLNGTDDPNTGMFPRIVLCDVARFALANLHKEHMQCVLMLNFINEKIYTFLWFWIVFITMASLFSALRQTAALLLPMYRALIADNFLPVSSRFISPSEMSSYLHSTQDVLFSNAAAEHGVRPAAVTSRALVDYFVHKVLRCDGVLLLSFINGNVGGLVTHDIAHQLWKITVQPTSNKRMEAAGDPNVNGGISMNNNKQQFAQPMARTRSLSVGYYYAAAPPQHMTPQPGVSYQYASGFYAEPYMVAASTPSQSTQPVIMPVAHDFLSVPIIATMYRPESFVNIGGEGIGHVPHHNPPA